MHNTIPYSQSQSGWRLCVLFISGTAGWPFLRMSSDRDMGVWRIGGKGSYMMCDTVYIPQREMRRGREDEERGRLQMQPKYLFWIPSECLNVKYVL